MLDRRRFLVASAAIGAASGLPSKIAEARVVTESKDDPTLPSSHRANGDEFECGHP